MKTTKYQIILTDCDGEHCLFEANDPVTIIMQWKKITAKEVKDARDAAVTINCCDQEIILTAGFSNFAEYLKDWKSWDLITV